MEFIIPKQLETKRLILRMFRDDKDWQELHKYYSDEDCTKYTTGRLLTESESWRAVASMIGHWHLRGYGPYAIEAKSSGKILGLVGLWYPNDWPEPEIKWGLIRQYWGQGFASEAARSVQKMASKYIPEISPISLIHSKNDMSINLAIAMKAEFEKVVEFRGDNWCVYRHR
jgi:RimJ/RimL family protein N-acetyltransferase